jgi:hypothetical protein
VLTTRPPKPLSRRLSACHQDVPLCIYSNWYMACVYIDWLLAISEWGSKDLQVIDWNVTESKQCILLVPVIQIIPLHYTTRVVIAFLSVA